MPIYEYRCLDCEAVFEKILSSANSQEKVTCTKCAGTNVRKKISAGSYRLAGGGSSIPAGALSGCSSKSGFS